MSAAADNTTLDMTMNSNFKSKINSSKGAENGVPKSRNAAIQVHARTDKSGNFRLTHLLNRGCPRFVIAAGKEDLIQGELLMKKEARHKRILNEVLMNPMSKLRLTQISSENRSPF
jgi:hypothetical protein